MSSPVETICKNSSIKEALDFMRQKKYKRAVVIDDEGRLEGVITQKELISLTYSRWARLIKEYHEELSTLNSTLETRAYEYEKQASIDSLTGLYNRSKFGELFNLSYKNMLSREAPLSIIMLDIDHFKSVNDIHGHNNGDKVLVALSRVLSTTLRNIDIICRWGGEEFVALLPTADLQQVQLIAEKLRHSIEQLNFSFLDNITASLGVSEVRRGESMLEAIERADKALYLAKSSGRNRVKTEADL
jgi:diguanylate cyclase (GGDEF)-like protein